MSIQVMSAVIDCPIKPASAKLTLLLYANFSDMEGGSIYPSLKRMAKLTSLCERQVQVIRKHLEDYGIIVATGKTTSGITMYRIDLDRLKNYEKEGGVNLSAPLEKEGGVNQDSPGGESGFTGGVNRDSPNPLINHQLNVNENVNKNDQPCQVAEKQEQHEEKGSGCPEWDTFVKEVEEPRRKALIAKNQRKGIQDFSAVQHFRDESAMRVILAFAQVFDVRIPSSQRHEKSIVEDWRMGALQIHSLLEGLDPLETLTAFKKYREEVDPHTTIPIIRPGSSVKMLEQFLVKYRVRQQEKKPDEYDENGILILN